jgi:putative (di)nucleoside polyphosphate hydrolase
MDVVIEFKRDVYMKALQELSRFLTRPNGEQRRRGPGKATGSRAVPSPAAEGAAEIGTDVAPTAE